MKSGQFVKALLKPAQKKSLTPKYLGDKIGSISDLADTLKVTYEQICLFSCEVDRYYHLHSEVKKADGSVRYIYAVREPFKSFLRSLNKIILRRCDFPDYITGSVKGSDFKANGERHAGHGTIVSVDVSNFFPSIDQKEVREIFLRFFGFPSEVSELLSLLCCYRGAMVQGAPTSSYLANLVFWDIEPLFVSDFLKNGYTYTRYVDDVAISRPERMSREEKTRAILTVKKMFRVKGLKAKNKKTKVMDRHVRQELHSRSLNRGSMRESKEKKSQLRARICKLRTEVLEGTIDSESLDNKSRSIRGSIYHYGRFNKSGSKKLLKMLDDI